MKLGRFLNLCFVVLFMHLHADSAALADEYPMRTVTFVVPFAPGAAVDIVTRMLAQKLGDRFGKPFVVENRAGAGTVIAASTVAKAKPDGYTLLIAASGTLAINPTLYRKLAYEPLQDFTPIALVIDIPLVLVINPGVPAWSIAELIKLAKENPGQLSFASSGPGTSFHLASELLKSMTGIEMTHVPYKGGPPALNDVIAGHVQLMFADTASALPQIKEGKVRALGVSSLARVPAAPDIPTVDESGVSGFEAVSWQLIVAPANTPKEIVDKLHTEIKAVMASQDVQQQLTTLGLIPKRSPPPEELQGFIASEIDRWAKVVRKAGIAGSE